MEQAIRELAVIDRLDDRRLGGAKDAQVGEVGDPGAETSKGVLREIELL